MTLLFVIIYFYIFMFFDIIFYQILNIFLVCEEERRKKENIHGVSYCNQRLATQKTDESP